LNSWQFPIGWASSISSNRQPGYFEGVSHHWPKLALSTGQTTGVRLPGISRWLESHSAVAVTDGHSGAQHIG
jgi:hypothetical protein